jgi:hypothetical protein
VNESYIISVLAVSLFVLVQSVAEAQDRKQELPVPDALLNIGTRERENGVLTNVVDVFILECNRGTCSLTTLLLNQCVQGWGTASRDSFFSPTIWRSSTVDGTLSVRNLGSQLEVSENLTGSIATTRGTYLIGYSLANSVTNYTNQVTSFGGAATVTIPYLKKVHTVEFVPFAGRDVWFKLDCNSVWLQGIDTTK